MIIKELEPKDRQGAIQCITEQWGSPILVSRGRVHRVDELPGLLAAVEGAMAGLLFYRIEGEECEIVSLDSWLEHRGVGSALLEARARNRLERENNR